MRRSWGLAAVALTATLTVGCSGGTTGANDPKNNKVPVPDGVAADKVGPAEEGGTVGGSGSPCALPVTFAHAKQWKVQSIPPDAAKSFTIGSFGPVCELDGKPAGVLGMIRVWQGGKPGENVESQLKLFADGDKSKDSEQPKLTPVKLTGVDAMEAAYQRSLDGVKHREYAIAVQAGGKVVVVKVGGIDQETLDEMMPAYLLARQTLAVGR
ncbi:lipoprotein [Actinocrispum wychmicini]|nr:lipoprotein [Actinocrispum wychmicini]